MNPENNSFAATPDSFSNEAHTCTAGNRDERSFSASPPPDKIPPYEPKVRRVGTLTLGLSLIAVGILYVLTVLYPNFNILLAAKFLPLTLVFLGLEILCNSLFAKGAKLKYDFLSGFFCFLLLLASIGAATLPILYEQYGPNRYRLEATLADELEGRCFELLQGLPVSGLDTNVSLNRSLSPAAVISLEDVNAPDNINLNISLLHNYQTKADFASDCNLILKRLSPLLKSCMSLSFSNTRTPDSNQEFSLVISDPFQMAMDSAGLQALTYQYEEAEQEPLAAANFQERLHAAEDAIVELEERTSAFSEQPDAQK